VAIFYCLRFETPQLAGPGPQEQGGRDIIPGNGFPYRRLLRIWESEVFIAMVMKSYFFWKPTDVSEENVIPLFRVEE
jgi:hypothetical protein